MLIEPGGRTADLARPIGADYHAVDTGCGPHLLVVDGSQLFALDDDLAARLGGLGRPELEALLAEAGVRLGGFVRDEPLPDPPIRALSLAVAERCNLGCTYCYAEGGSFGGAARAMGWDTAKRSVARLLAAAAPGERVNLGFLGGEPLANRPLIRRATRLAAGLARRRGVAIGFSITTNGTLLREDDAAFFARHGFSVTVSLDGIGAVHDRLRPAKGGRGTYQRILRNIRPLLATPGRLQVSARVTVTPRNLDLRETLDGLADLGFHSVGFSPMLASPGQRDQMEDGDLDRLLEQMIDCGREFERRMLAGQPYPFANLQTALREIHRGTHRPYPCGAGAGYLGVDAGGELFACHRFVGDPAGALGDVASGVDRERQRRWLAERRVERQQPCQSCWARYLCGGGCHYEVLHRGRPACDYIRGWLDYALGAYARLSQQRPELFLSSA